MKRKNIVSFAIAVFGLSMFLFVFLYNTDVFAAKTGKVTTDSLNVRTGAGTNYSILTDNGTKVKLNKGTAVTISSEKNGWYYISFAYNKKTLKGYVSKAYVGSVSGSTSSTTTTTKTGTVNASSLKVRKGAGTTYAQLTSSGKGVLLAKGTKVTIGSEKNGWYYVSFTYNGKTLKGYVSKQYVTVASSGSSSNSSSSTSTSTKTLYKISAKTRSSLKVRKAAGSTAAQLTYNKAKVVLKKSQNIVVRNETIKNSAKWYYISFTYSGKTLYGWVAADYVQLTLKTSVSAHVRPSNVQILKNTSGTKFTVNGAAVKLTKNTNVTITKEYLAKNVRYYKVSFKYKSKSYTGYIKAYDVIFGKSNASSSTPSTQPTPTPPPAATPAPTVMSKTDFTAKMVAEGFPADYIDSLYALHTKHPAWTFKAYKVSQDWATSISKQTATRGKASIQSTAYQWISDMVKSTDATSAYDVLNDRPFVTDGTNWVTASSTAVQYYMDPRNFLDESHIFMFENLGYDKTNHTKAAVLSMVTGTPLAGSFTYTDGAGKLVTMSYVDAIMDAANYSNVSPIHLTARIKQEVFTYSNGAYVFSGSCTGTYPGYEGLYNFYNIGASDSATGGAITNGLNYAKKGGTNATLNVQMFIPWNTPYKSIMGGAKFIGDSYIAKGQSSLYLQKFNVSSYKPNDHQYMTNIKAPYAEAEKSYSGYSKVGLLDSNLVFSIPVFTGMPTTRSIHPDNVADNDKKNFNNYLKDCKITDGVKTTYVSAANKNFNFRLGTGTNTPEFSVPSVNAAIAPVVAGKGAAVTQILITPPSGKPYNVGVGQAFGMVKGRTQVKITVQSANGKTRDYNLVLVQ